MLRKLRRIIMKKVFVILLGCLMIMNFTACQNADEEVSLVSTDSVSSSSEDNSNFSSNINDELTAKLPNGNVVGKLYKEHYYDILNSSHYIYNLKTDNSIFKSAVYSTYLILECESSDSQYKFLANSEGNYWVSDENKTVTVIPDTALYEIRSMLNNQIFTDLSYVDTYTETYENKEYKVESYEYSNSKNYVMFYFDAQNTLKIIKDDQNIVYITDITNKVSKDYFNTPENYEIITEFKLENSK